MPPAAFEPPQLPASLDALHLGDVVPSFDGLLFLIDREGVILDFRTGAQAQPYLPPADFLGRRVAEVLPPDAAASLVPAIERTATGEVSIVSYSLPFPDGPRTFEAVMIPLAGGRAFVTVTHTSRATRAEEALREREAELRAILETEPECVKVIAPDGSLLQMNRAGLEMLEEPTLESARARRLLDYVAPEHRSAFTSMSRRVFAGESGVVAFEIIGSKGTRRWVESHAVPMRDASGTIVALLGITRDVTARRAAEDALRASEERMRALLEAGLDLVFALDDAGKITFASPAVERVLGYSVEEVVGKSLPSFVHPDDNAALLPRFAELRSTRRPVMQGSARMRHRDGRWLVIDGVIRDLRANPTVRGIVFNGRDVSEQRALQEQLFQSDKLDSIGRLAGGIAHDFNNVLTAILGTVDVVQSEMRRGRIPTADDFEEIKRAGRRARELTSQLLAFARRQAVAPRLVDPNEIVRGMEQMMRRLLGEHIELAIVLEPQPWLIHADPSQLEQVILNLVVNARDAMPQGGTLHVATRNVEIDAAYAAAHRDVTPGPHLQLSVRDSGSGIAPDALPHIFEPFYSTKPTGEGAGLGLATVYGVVRQSRGHITVSSETGEGTTFDVYFPKAGAGTPDPIVDDAATVCDTVGSETVLLVEDDELVRALGVRGLKDAGYDVLVASDPDEASAIAGSFGGHIDILVTDVAMPKRSGTVLARELLASRPDMKVLYVSGYTSESILQQGVLNPGIHFLPKPFTPSELRDRVRQVLDG